MIFIVDCGVLRALAAILKRAGEGAGLELKPLLSDAVNTFLLLLAENVGVTVEVTEVVKYVAREVFSFYEAAIEDSSFDAIPFSFTASIILNVILLLCLLVAVFKIKNPQTTFGTRFCKRKRPSRHRRTRQSVNDDTHDFRLSTVKVVETAV